MKRTPRRSEVWEELKKRGKTGTLTATNHGYASESSQRPGLHHEMESNSESSQSPMQEERAIGGKLGVWTDMYLGRKVARTKVFSVSPSGSVSE